MNNVYFSSHRLTLGKEVSPSPDMSINSDGSVGTKKVLLYSSNSTKFFPKEKEETQELKINISEDMSFNNTDHTPQNKNLQNSPSPKRSAIRNKGKSGTSYFFNPDNASELNDEGPQRTEAKKKTIKFGEKDEVKFFTMKEMSSKHDPTSRKNSLSRSRASVSSKNHSSNSRKYSSSIANTFKEDEEKAGESTLFKNRKNGTADFGKSIAVIMIINHFLKQMKLKSGKFGRLGNKQFKILNDLGHDPDEGAKDDQYEFEPNLMARMIKKFRTQHLNKNKKALEKLKNIAKSFTDKLKGETWVIFPNNRLKLCYNFVVFMSTLLEFIYIPLDACFQISENVNWYLPWRKIIYSTFLLDIVLNLNTGYFTKGTLILERRVIVKNYFKLRFWIDLCTVSPIFIDTVAGILSRSFKFINFCFLVRIFYLNEMIRKICDFYNSGEFINSIIGLIKLCIITLYVAHMCACLWRYISYIDSQYYHVTWLTVFIHNEEELTLSNEYITSLYWAVTTMITVGYGDIIPRTPNEKVFAITSMLLACCVFAYIMNSIGLVISSFNNRQAILRHKIQAVNKYLDLKNIDYDLRIRIRKYLEYLYEEKNALVREGQTVVANLSSALKTEIFQRLNGEIIGKIPILIKTFTPKLLTQLTLLMKEVSFTPEDLIFAENEFGNQELFFIYEGEVEIFIENFSGFKEDTSLKKLKRGDYFGEVSFFSNQPRSASVKSLGFSNLISLSREDFLGVIRNFSFDYEKYCMISESITLYKSYYSINIKCFCCNINNHLAIECPMVHVVLNKDRIIRDFIHSEPNERLPFMRNPRNKFQVLKNLNKLINATLKIHRTTTFELYNYPDDEENEETEYSDEQESNQIHFNRNNKYIMRHNSQKDAKEKSPKKKSGVGVISVAPPYRKSRSYTRNFDLNSYNISKFNSNSVIYEEREREDDKKRINDHHNSNYTHLTEIKLIAPENNMISNSNRTSLLSPNTNLNMNNNNNSISNTNIFNTNVFSNPNVVSYFSLSGANMSTIEKKQETLCISDAGAYFPESFSPSKNSNVEPPSQTNFDENLSDDLESYQSSLAPQRSKASKKSEMIYSTISQNQKSSNSLNVSPSLPNPSMTTLSKTSKREEKKNFKLPPVSSTIFLQNNYFQILSKDREEFENSFEKMKIFDVYFPHNNVTVILEDYRKLQIRARKRRGGRVGGSLISHTSPQHRNLSTLIKNIPIFRKTLGSSAAVNEDKGDGNFRKRRMSEAGTLRSNTLKSGKTLKNNKWQCKFWICSCCKKSKTNNELKKKLTLARGDTKLNKRVSVAERLRRASIYK